MNGGMEFSPRGRELIFYLKRKFDAAAAQPPNEIVEELDFYQYTPDELSEKHAESIKQGKLYFFTRVFRKFPDTTSPVPHREVRDVGIWKDPLDRRASDFIYTSKRIGTKLVLYFHLRGFESNAALIPTHWVMEEYKTGQPLKAGSTMYHWVLCKVYRIDIDGNAVAIPNNQANQAVERPIAGGDVGQYFGGNNDVDGTGTQQGHHPRVLVQTCKLGVPGDMAPLQSHESQMQQNNNNNSSVRVGGMNELMAIAPCQLLTWKGTGEVVAEGTLLSVDPLSLVGGVTLGELCCAVSVSRVFKNEEVYRYAPTSNFRSLEDATEMIIAWPKCCIREYPPWYIIGLEVGK